MLSYHRIISGQKRGVLSSFARALLAVLSVPYAAIIEIRNRGYQRKWWRIQSVPIPVVSVGNLTVGGTGKTPMVAFLCKWFRQQGVRVTIVSRGYRADADGTNDEAKELEIQLPDVPHLQNARRHQAASLANEEFDSQLVVLDDGFQHRQLHRDLDIVLLDATNPFGYNQLLPRGLLREPLTSLQRADVVVATRADQVSNQVLANIRTKVQRYAPKAAWVETAHAPVCLQNFRGVTNELGWLSGRPVVAFCGIGNGAAFFETLRKLDVQVVETLEFPDHHAYSRQDIERIQEIAGKRNVSTAICTGKDLPKIGVEALGGLAFWSLRIELQILCGLEPLQERLHQIMQRIPADAEE
jgi:tetraacyldisaccharide 4'-kinase